MKTKIFSLLVAAMIIFNVSFAHNPGDTVNQTVKVAFSHQFEKASDVNWTKTSNYFKATFTWNGQFLTAFFRENGEPIAMTRNLLTNELPLTLQTNLSEDYTGFWVSELFEYVTDDSSKYYITVENADKLIILESVDYNYWSVLKKSSKE